MNYSKIVKEKINKERILKSLIVNLYFPNNEGKNNIVSRSCIIFHNYHIKGLF